MSNIDKPHGKHICLKPGKDHPSHRCYICGYQWFPDGKPCFWVISEERLMSLLQRAAAGEDVDLLYAEEYANAGVSR